MCRIAGIITANSTENNHLNQVEMMCEAMKHGGPDGKGIFQSINRKATIGNRRLSLIDLSKDGMQPMRFGNQLTITYNGECYNHLEIKAILLKLGCNFNTESDTEVILAAYQQWGVESFKMLKGMFAFCIIDEAIDKVFLVRGPVGIKPLYYAVEKENLIFASEVKAFLTYTPAFKEQPEWKTYFLAFGHIPEPYTTLEGVSSLPKGYFLEMDLNSGKLRMQKYFSFNYKETITKKKEAEKAIRNALRLSVRKHLFSDAPIGLFLSGGIDSSILALLGDESTRYLTTISVNFSDPTFSEKKYQSIIAKKMLSKHAGYTLTFSDFEKDFERAMCAMDQPSNDGINTWFISKFAKENGLKTVLSGIGADELFGGYTSFQRSFFLKTFRFLPSFLLKAIALTPFNRMKRFYFLSYKNLVGDYLFLRGIYTPKVIAKLLNKSLEEINQTLSTIKLETPPISFSSEKARISWLETNFYLQNQLLKDTDYMSMSHGLEVRTPFLDIDFIQTCLNIKSSIRFDNKQKKKLLVDAFEGILPNTIWSRKKMGFTFPFTNWLKRINRINNPNIYRNNPEAYQIFKKFKSGNLSWAKILVLYQISDGK